MASWTSAHELKRISTAINANNSEHIGRFKIPERRGLADALATRGALARSMGALFIAALSGWHRSKPPR